MGGQDEGDGVPSWVLVTLGVAVTALIVLRGALAFPMPSIIPGIADGVVVLILWPAVAFVASAYLGGKDLDLRKDVGGPALVVLGASVAFAGLYAADYALQQDPSVRFIETAVVLTSAGALLVVLGARWMVGTWVWNLPRTRDAASSGTPGWALAALAAGTVLLVLDRFVPGRGSLSSAMANTAIFLLALLGFILAGTLVFTGHGPRLLRVAGPAATASIVGMGLLFVLFSFAIAIAGVLGVLMVGAAVPLLALRALGSDRRDLVVGLALMGPTALLVLLHLFALAGGSGI